MMEILTDNIYNRATDILIEVEAEMGGGDEVNQII